MAKRKVIVTCAVTGNAPVHPNYPYQYPITPQEICEAVVEAASEGAAIAHIHVRDPDTGQGCRDAVLFREVVERIRETGVDIVINLTGGGGALFFPDPANEGRALPESDVAGVDERLKHIEDCMPEIASLDVTTGNQVEAGVDYVYLNTTRTLRAMATRYRAAGIKPELEAFQSGDVLFANQLVEDGLVSGTPLYQFVLGVKWGAPATPESMFHLRSLLPQNAVWTGMGISRMQMPMAAQSIILGGHVRVGLEDNLYLERGVFATNGQLVARARNLLDALGCEAATPSETRQLLDLRVA